MLSACCLHDDDKHSGECFSSFFIGQLLIFQVKHIICRSRNTELIFIQKLTPYKHEKVVFVKVFCAHTYIHISV